MIETDRLVLYTLAPQLVALLSAGDLQGARALRLPYTIDEIDGLEWVHSLPL